MFTVLAAEITFDQTADVLVSAAAFFAMCGGFYQFLWKPFVHGDEERAQRIADKAAEKAVVPLQDALTKVSEQVNVVKGEVTTNGGKSLKDVVLDTRERQVILEAKFDQHMKEAHQ